MCLKDITAKVFATVGSSAVTGQLSSLTDKTEVYSVRGNSSQLHPDWWLIRHNDAHWFALKRVKFAKEWYFPSNPYWLPVRNAVSWLHKEWWCNFISSISQNILASSVYFWAQTNRIFFTTFILFYIVSPQSPSPLSSQRGVLMLRVGRECVLVGTCCSQNQTWVKSQDRP